MKKAPFPERLFVSRITRNYCFGGVCCCCCSCMRWSCACTIWSNFCFWSSLVSVDLTLSMVLCRSAWIFWIFWSRWSDWSWMIVIAWVCWSWSALFTLACCSVERLSCCARTCTWSSIEGPCPGCAELCGCWLWAPGCWPYCPGCAPGFCEGWVWLGWLGCMLPCDCGTVEDWLELGYCQANALTASNMRVHKMIAALGVFIGLFFSFGICGQSFCDADFSRREGSPALDFSIA